MSKERVSANGKRLLSFVLVLIMLASLLPVLTPSVRAEETVDHVIISQIYGAGGNSGATYNTKFIEFYNPTDAEVDLSSWSVQYGSATGSGDTNLNIFNFPSDTKITAGGYLLASAGSGTNGTDLPVTVDISLGSVNPAAANGKLALVNDQTRLNHTTVQSSNTVVDFVGYGTANYFWGTGTAPAPSTTASIIRKTDAITEAPVNTDDNKEDFITCTPPAPRNSSYSNVPATQVAAPTASPAPGAVASGTLVTLTCATAGAEIWYTTDGTIPSKDGPGSTEYNAPITITQDTTIKAIALDPSVSDPLDPSEVVTFAYTVAALTTIAEVRAAEGSTETYVIEGVATMLMGGNNLFMQDATGGIVVFRSGLSANLVGHKIQVVGQRDVYNGLVEIVPTADITDLGEATGGDIVVPEEVTIAELNADSAGTYQGKLVKITGAELVSIAGTGSSLVNHVITQPGATAITFRAPGLPAATYSTGDLVDIVCVVGMYNTVQVLASSTSYITRPELQPVKASPASGSGVKAGGTITLSTTTAGAVIEYTVNNGATQTSSGGSVDITISAGDFTQPGSTAVIKAKAKSAGGDYSIERTFTYTQREVASVTTSVTPGPVEEDLLPISVALSSTDSGLEGFAIYYTTDGSDPDTNATLYTGEIIINSVPATIKAIAVATGCLPSAVSTFAYTQKVDYVLDGERGTAVNFRFSAEGGGSGPLVTTKTGDHADVSSMKFMKAGSEIIPTCTANGAMVNNLNVEGDRYWLFTLSSAGFANLTFEGMMRSTAAGPRDFKGQYSMNGSDWIDIPDGAIEGSTTAAPFSLTLPDAASNQPVLYVRLIITSTRRGDDANKDQPFTTGNNEIQNITLSGDYILGDNQVYPAVPDPMPGAVYPGTQVTFTSRTEGAAFKVSTDGQQSWADAAEVVIDSFPMTFHVQAVKAGMTDSRVKELTYTEKKLLDVKASRPSGPVYANTEIYLTNDEANADIIYTLLRNTDVGGGTAVVTDETYTGPITLLEEWFPVQIVAKATMVVNGNTLTADPTTFDYTLRPPPGDDWKNYFGQLHSHTGNAEGSDGTGTVQQAYDHAAAADNVDFLAITDHSNGNFPDDKGLDSDRNTATDNDTFDKLNLTTYNSTCAKWVAGLAKKDAMNAATAQTNFVALYGYEMTWSGGPGHMNTLNTSGFVSRNNNALNNKLNDAGLKLYYDLLAQTPGSISQFNHPGTTFGNFSNFAYITEERDERIQLVEVGNGEGGVGTSQYWPSYEQYTLALDRGWHLAPSNNQDNHKGNWGDSNTARTVVYTNDFTEQGIYDAIEEMRVYATEDNNLSISYTVDDELFGTQLPSKDGGEAHFEIVVEDPDAADTIKRVEVITNGGRIFKEFVYSGATLSNKVNISFNEAVPDGYYYVRVTQSDSNIAVTAPVWFGNPILAGFDGVSTTTIMPVTNEALPIKAELFNNQDTAVTLVSLSMAEKGKEPFYTETINASIAAKGGTYEITQSYTPTAVGLVTIVTTAVINVAGQDITYTYEIDLTVRDSNSLIYIGVDGSHYNEYVTGNYKDNVTNFAKLAAQSEVRVNVLQTKEELIAATDNPKYKAIVLTVPSRRLYQALPGTAEETYKNYEPEVIEAIKVFAENGGTLILTSWSNTYENYSGLREMPLDEHMSAQQNKILAAIGSTLRTSDDAAGDTVYNSGGDANRMFLVDAGGSYNWNSPLLAGAVNEQIFSQYGGSTIYAVSSEDKDRWDASPSDTLPNTVTPVISTSTNGTSTDRESAENLNHRPQMTIPKYNDRYLILASETLVHEGGGTSEVIVAGGAFLSNFEIAAEVENATSLNYSNNNILENIILSLGVVQDIADVQKAAPGTPVIIEAIATSGTTSGFFDCIYAQDETGGINLFPVSDGVSVGQKIRVWGAVGAYQGETQIQVSRYQVIDETINPVEPTGLATAATMSSAKTGLLVKTSGVILEIIGTSGDTMQFTIDDGTGPAIAYINAYITPDVDMTGFSVGDKITVTGLASIGENLSSSEDMLPRIRVRDRREITPFDGYIVNFITNGGTEIGQIHHLKDAGPITLQSAGDYVTTRSGYTFAGWYLDKTFATPVGFPYTQSSDEGTITNLYAKWSQDTPGGPSAPKPPATTEYVPAVITKVDENGKAITTVKAGDIISAVDKAKGKEDAVIIIKAEITGDVSAEDIKTVEISIPASAAGRIVDETDASVTFETPIASASFNGTALETIMSAGSGDMTLTISIIEKEDLDADEEALEKIGDRPIYSFTVMKGNAEVSDFNGGKATVMIPYTPKAGENLNAIVVYAIDSDGNLNIVRGRYDEASGAVVAVTTQFLPYVAVGYNAVTFVDVPESDYYKPAIDFIAARGITNGTGNNMFSGDEDITRAMFLVMVMRAYTIGPDDVWTDNFDDAGNTWYTDYLAAARRLGLVSGVGDNLYEPDRAITRQEMFVLLYNVLKAIGELPEADPDPKKLEDYLDEQNIAPWARDATGSLVESGLIVGDGIRLMPRNLSTRSQMAQVLYNILTR